MAEKETSMLLSRQENSHRSTAPSSHFDVDEATLHYSKSVLQKVHLLRSHKKLCDVTLSAEGREINAHRAILSACSAYFLAMFTHELLESGQDVVQIKGMSGDVLSSLIDFAYTGVLTVTVENVQDTLAAASLLQIKQAQEVCCEFLKNHLDVSNCLGVKNFAEVNGCTQLSEVVDSFARRHFLEVTNTNEFFHSSAEGIASLISSNDLNVPREEVVYAAVMSWVRQDPGERGQQLPKLLKHVRLPLLAVDCLMNDVDRDPIVKQSIECRDLLDDAKRYHLMPADRDIRSANPCFFPRKSTVGVVYAVGGKESSESITHSVETFSLLENKWSEGTPLMVRRQQLGVGVLDGKVYAVGGSDGSLRLSTVECFDPATQFWTYVAPLSTCRSGVAVGVMGGAMYAAGGYDGRSCLNTVERFDLEKNVWVTVAQMSSRRSFPGVAVFGDKLYTFGGNDGTSFLNVVECYDPHVNRWRTLPPLGKPRAGIGVAVLGQQIFVAGGNDGTSRLDSVEFLDVRSGKWYPAAKMTSARDGVCLCAIGAHMVAVGGINGPSYLKTAELYDPVNNSWDLVSSMETCRAAAGVAVVM